MYEEGDDHCDGCYGPYQIQFLMEAGDHENHFVMLSLKPLLKSIVEPKMIDEEKNRQARKVG